MYACLFIYLYYFLGVGLVHITNESKRISKGVYVHACIPVNTWRVRGEGGGEHEAG